MKYILFLFIVLVFSGCFNQNGVSAEYYDECHTVYDSYGNYETICPYNFYNYKKQKKKDCLQCN